VQVDHIKPKLKAPGTKRLKLKCYELLSSFAFTFNLRRYTMGDLGVRKGMAGVYGLSELPSPAKMVGPAEHVWRELFCKPYPRQLFTSSTVCETSSLMLSAASCDEAGIVSSAMNGVRRHVWRELFVRPYVMTEIAASWGPYKTLGSMYMWHEADRLTELGKQGKKVSNGKRKGKQPAPAPASTRERSNGENLSEESEAQQRRLEHWEGFNGKEKSKEPELEEPEAKKLKSPLPV